VLTFLCILDSFFLFSLLFMNLFLGAVSSMSFFIWTSLILRPISVFSSWGRRLMLALMLLMLQVLGPLALMLQVLGPLALMLLMLIYRCWDH